MNKQKSIFFALLLALTAFSSCGGSKKMTAVRVDQGSADRSTIDRLAVEQLFIDATKSKLLEDYQDAAEKYKQVLKLDPYNDAAQYELALILFNSGQNDIARQYIQQAVWNDSINYVYNEVQKGLLADSNASVKSLGAKAQSSYLPNKWYLILQADIYTSLANYDGAIKVYQKLLNAYPVEYDYYFDLAFVFIKSNKYQDALKLYEKLESQIGLDPNLTQQKQRLYILLGQTDKAIAEIKKLIEEFPDEPGYYQMLAEVYQATDRNDEVIKVYEDLLKISPGNPYALLNLAEIYRQKNDRVHYIQYLKEAFNNPELGIDSKVRILYPYLQTFGKDTARDEEAFALSQILIEAHPEDAKSHAIYGDFLYQDEQMEEALTQYKLALEIDSSEFAIWQQIFFILSDKQAYAELVDYTERALELFPNQAIVYFFNGISYNQLKQYQKAIDILNSGKNYVVDNNALRVQFYSSLGDAHNSMGNFDESDQAFESALAYDKNNAYVLNNYSYYLSLRNDNLEKAKSMSLRSNELEPNNGSFQDTYAWILFRMGEYNDALKWIEKSMANGEENNPTILEHYGDILYQLKLVEKAIDAWKKAKEAGSDSKSIDRKIADRKYYE
ncbi:MAG: tetratricopeptide repeat protein [Chitinophagales bacterium]|nr:tetratricopeptide repeat protein [Chitinophagales bacterium]